MHHISKILFCHTTLHVSGIFCAHHQELSTVHTAIGMFHAGYVTASKQSQVGMQQITPDDGHRRCPKHAEFYDKIKFWIFDASSWLFYMKLVTMHSHVNIKNTVCISSKLHDMLSSELTLSHRYSPNLAPRTTC